MAEENDDELQLIDDSGEVEASLARTNRENFERSLVTQNLWQHSAKGLEAKRAAMTMLSTKTGMYARIPLLCKGDDCPYTDTCQLLPYDLAPVGEYCPQETAQIELRANAYAQDFDVDTMSFTDKTLLNEIIGFDIMLERCRALMAKEGTPVVEVVAGIADNGDEIKQPAVSKAWEAYEKISKKRDAAYQLMMMTRRDNKNNSDEEQSALSAMLDNVITEQDVEEEKDK
jgi:hypothetical protein